MQPPKPKAAPAPASHSAKPVSSQNKFVNALLRFAPFTLVAIFKWEWVPGGERRQTSQFVNGAISDFYLFNWIARPPTIQPNPPCTLSVLSATPKLITLQAQCDVCAGALAILHHSGVPLMVRLQHAVPIRQIIQKSEVNLLWFYGFLLSLGSWEFLGDSQSVYSVRLLYGGPACFLTNVHSVCWCWWISLALNSDSAPSFDSC